MKVFQGDSNKRFHGLTDPPFHLSCEDFHRAVDGFLARLWVLILKRGPDFTGFIVGLGGEQFIEDAGLFNLVLSDELSYFALSLVHCRGLWFVVSNACYLKPSDFIQTWDWRVIAVSLRASGPLLVISNYQARKCLPGSGVTTLGQPGILSCLKMASAASREDLIAVSCSCVMGFIVVFGLRG